MVPKDRARSDETPTQEQDRGRHLLTLPLGALHSRGGLGGHSGGSRSLIRRRALKIPDSLPSGYQWVPSGKASRKWPLPRGEGSQQGHLWAHVGPGRCAHLQGSLSLTQLQEKRGQ